jgi:hypothetical protein
MSLSSAGLLSHLLHAYLPHPEARTSILLSSLLSQRLARLDIQYPTAGGYWIARSSRAMTARSQVNAQSHINVTEKSERFHAIERRRGSS